MTKLWLYIFWWAKLNPQRFQKCSNPEKSTGTLKVTGVFHLAAYCYFQDGEVIEKEIHIFFYNKWSITSCVLESQQMCSPPKSEFYCRMIWDYLWYMHFAPNSQISCISSQAISPSDVSIFITGLSVFMK